MNKQKVLEELDKTEEEFLQVASNVEIDSNSRSVATGVVSGLGMSKNFIEQLDEPQKVKVPAFVAEWIEQAKEEDRTLFEVMDDIYGSCYYHKGDDETFKWLFGYDESPENQKTFAKAYLDGYEIEEEPKYYLDLPKIGILNEVSNNQLNWTNCEGGITEKAIKSIDERYWPFAVPVEKV